MDKGKLCYACLLPKDVCIIKKCKFEGKVPETLKCQGCAPWARSKDLSPFLILFCRNKEHAHCAVKSTILRHEEGPGEVYWKAGDHCSGLFYQVLCKLCLSGVLIESWGR